VLSSILTDAVNGEPLLAIHGDRLPSTLKI